MKNLKLAVLGVVLGMGLMQGLMYKPTFQQESEQTILGHRIGPGGQEMLVFQE